jgi:hypothetical protein
LFHRIHNCVFSYLSIVYFLLSLSFLPPSFYSPFPLL